jgi:hypothetical protein
MQAAKDLPPIDPVTLDSPEELSVALVAHALHSQLAAVGSVNGLARLLRLPRSSVLSVLAVNARAGTVALVVERARELGWISPAATTGATGA